ncbi:MAG: peptidoglycan-binding protein LysM [Acidobacteriota bacterium]|nr:peptidoglycan-binding protein LysM [Acidobacteriota bacterium]
MGLFDFIKDAGKKIFHKDDGAAVAAAQEAAGAAAEKVKAENLTNFVQGLGLEIDDLVLVVDDDLVTVSGTAPSQEIREKVVLAIGNTAGIARVDDQLVVVAPEPEARFYTVVRGDSLSKIAKEFYGNAMKYPVIFEANKPMLSDPDKIYPGQMLRIPPQD